ncbi:MAG: hypothetical protein ACXVA9_01995 [Bdellovibrionales bacterium]
MTEEILVSLSLLMSLYTGIFYRTSADRKSSALFVALNSLLFFLLLNHGPVAIFERQDRGILNNLSDFLGLIGGFVLLHAMVFSIGMFITIMLKGQFFAGLRLMRKRMRIMRPERQLMFGGIIILCISLIAGIFSPSRRRDSNAVSGFALNDEEKEQVKYDFNLARNLYVKGKYELCLSQLEKVNQVVMVYENSSELKTFCLQGRELVMRQRQLETAQRKLATAGKSEPADTSASKTSH